MAARRKLNQAYFNGAMFLAALVGFVAQSWTVFVIAAAIGVAGSLVGGELRLASPNRSSSSRRPRFNRRRW
jgi:hypothetical protein